MIRSHSIFPLSIISISITISLLVGCGVYTFSGHGIAGIKTISVEPFDNQTAEFGIREQITDALIEKLLSSRTLTLASQAAADAVLKGRIVGFTEEPLTFDENEQVQENKVTIVIEVELVKPGRSEPLWKGRLAGDGSYPYQTGNPQEREEGINKAVERLVQDLVNSLTSDW